jgi:hypothetical protein
MCRTSDPDDPFLVLIRVAEDRLTRMADLVVRTIGVLPPHGIHRLRLVPFALHARSGYWAGLEEVQARDRR